MDRTVVLKKSVSKTSRQGLIFSCFNFFIRITKKLYIPFLNSVA